MSYKDYIREEKLPLMWCKGCSHGITLASIARAMDTQKLDPEKTVVVTGIGCWGKSDDYFRTHVFHGTHGRALSFATGIKVPKEELKVLVLMGDGDGTTIGGNHFIHTARRNIDMTAIVTNNFNYGMTGGQYSSTSPEGSITSTSIYGTAEKGIDICDLAITSGATYVARSTPYHVKQMDNLIADAIDHKGFSMVEVTSLCPTYYGRYNYRASSVDMMKMMKDQGIKKSKYDELDESKKEECFPIGKLHQVEEEDFNTKYKKLKESIN